MTSHILALDPFRWKVFQVLTVPGENDTSSIDRKGDIDKWTITNAQFKEFCDRHRHLPCFVPESNELMASSYLVLDEDLCFLDKGGTEMEKRSDSILIVGVQAALRAIRWDQGAFQRRGGLYDWSKDSDRTEATVPVRSIAAGGSVDSSASGGCAGCPGSFVSQPNTTIPDMEDLF
jgi:radical S-adenosyl methionine domain-containing protein 2